MQKLTADPNRSLQFLLSASWTALKNEISLSCTQEVVDYISDKGYDPQFGARPIKRLIQKEVLNQLSKDILCWLLITLF